MATAEQPDLLPLEFLSGIRRDKTNYQNKGGWFASSRIRFRNGVPESIKGWQRYTTTTFIGVCRSLFRFVVRVGTIYMGMGTSKKFYVETGGVPVDVTPIRRTVNNASNIIATTNGSSILTVTDSGGHAAEIGDYVIISDATTFNNITAAEMNAEHIIVDVPSATTFTIQVTSVANATGSGGGTIIDLNYLYYSGADFNVAGTGWGAGPWGDSSWGTARDFSSTLQSGSMRQWTQDSYDEDLVFCPRDGPLFYWDASNPNSRGVFVSAMGGASDVPVVATGVFVSDRDRHVVAYGCNVLGGSVQDLLKIRWSDTEDIVDWTPTTTNTAGGTRAGIGSKFIGHMKSKQETLIWTDKALYALRWIGGNEVFALESLAVNVQIAGINAAISRLDVVYWMGRSGFYKYDGSVDPILCEIEEYIRQNVNWDQADQICAGTINNEIIWFYPSMVSTEIDSYVKYHVTEKVFDYGSLARTYWLDDGFGGFPMAAHSDGYVYQHEFGTTDGPTNSDIGAYIESSPIELGHGTEFTLIDRLIPDVTFEGSTGTPSVNMILKARNQPGSAEHGENEKAITRIATTPVEQFTAWKSIWLRGRSFIFRIESNAAGAMWRLGVPRVSAQPDGEA